MTFTTTTTDPKKISIDTKLQHLIHKIINSLTTTTTSSTSTTNLPSSNNNSNSNTNNNTTVVLSSKQILNILLTKHREYQRRKNYNTLQTQIDEIIISFVKSNKKFNTPKICNKTGSLIVTIGSTNHRNNNNKGNSSVLVPIGKAQPFVQEEDYNNNYKETTISGKKRKQPPQQPNQQQQQQQQPNQPKYNHHQHHFSSDDEEEYDKAAIQNDNIIISESSSSLLLSSSSMLNANLRNRYKDVQRERDIIARKKAKADEMIVINNNNNEQQQQQQDIVVDEHTTAIDNNNIIDGNSNQQVSLSTVPEDVEASSTNDNENITTSTIAATTTQSTPMKKKKKKILSRSSSNNNLYNNSSTDQSSSSTTFMTSPTPRPKERYSDLGGISDTLTQIRQLIEYPLSHPELFAHLGIHPPRGVLLRGPPGCGKTHIANAIAGQLNVTFYKISAPEIVSSMSGESESRLRDLFSIASSTAPSIIFMDEIDAIAPKRGGDGSTSGGSKSMEKRIVAQLLTCMDSLTPENNRNGSPVMVLAATNRPDSIDSALRRAGRFDREIILGVPDEEGRESILKVMTNGMRLSGDIDFKLLAKKTPGFVGADVRSLTKEAGVIAINRIFKKILIDDSFNVTSNDDVSASNGTADNDAEQDCTMQEEQQSQQTIFSQSTDAFDIHSVKPFSSDQMEPLSITMDDFLKAVPHVQPSSKREGFATVPDVSWDNIGALQCIREELSLSVLEPITHPEKFKALGLPLPAGVLLYGPPGCGKTLLAKAVANESGANFISVKGPELLDKYVGESERAVRQVFERARSSSPCIVFFDELDSLCPKRGSDSSGGGVSERVVNQLLTEMDGLDTRRSVFVIAATNRPELIDPAMLRPGRLDKLLYVPLPSPNDRVAILKANAKNIKLGPDVNLEAIALSSRADGYSGADCAALLREAGLAVLRDDALNRNKGSSNVDSNNDPPNESIKPLEITASHFEYAFNHVMPSVSKKDQARYDKMRDRMARARTRGTLTDENPPPVSSTPETVV